MEQEQLASILESLLFVSARPLKAKDLAKILEVDSGSVTLALGSIAEAKKNSGVILLENGGEYQLSTSGKNSTRVKNFLNAELREKLTDATVEVLAIIAYRQPISKAEIEAIRGVNSQYSLRNLLIRGMIEKTPNPADNRSFLYQTTTEFLMHMGMASVSELPEFEKLVGQIKLPQTPALENNGVLEQALETKSQQASAVTEVGLPNIESREPKEVAAEETAEDDIDDEEEDSDDEEEDNI